MGNTVQTRVGCGVSFSPFGFIVAFNVLSRKTNSICQVTASPETKGHPAGQSVRSLVSVCIQLESGWTRTEAVPPHSLQAHQPLGVFTKHPSGLDSVPDVLPLISLKKKN